MTKVIAALDNSAATKPTLETALRLGELLDAGVEALHVIEDDASSKAGIVSTSTSASVASSLGVELHLRRGLPQDEIVAALEQLDVVTGVLGARGHPAGRRPAGHVALDVVQRTRKPIVVVPPDCREPGPCPPEGRILIPLDGTQATAQAIERASDVFAGRGIDILALHVFDETTVPRFWNHTQYEPDEWGREFLRRYCRARGAHLELVSGDPGQSVLDVAAGRQIDLVAMAWSQDLRSGHAETVRRVLAECSVPVMLLPVGTPSRHDRLDQPNDAANTLRS
jgi:nucleotide-binding universal stress UspA family protein